MKSKQFIYVLCSFLFIINTKFLTAQNNDFLGHIVPPTPNAASFGKYGEIPVNEHTGVPDINVPLYTLSEGPLTLPISLSYHSSGIKVSETAGWAGLGWTLNAGGAIVRTVRNAPDEGLHLSGVQGYYANQTQNTITNPDANFAESAAEGLIDTEPDIFYFNFNGYTGKFFFDGTGPSGVNVDPYQDLHIEPHFAGNGARFNSFTYWVITTPDGTKYYFGDTSDDGLVQDPDDAIDMTNTFTYNGSAKTLTPTVNAWYLVRIEDANNTRVIDLEYEFESYRFSDLGSYQTNLLLTIDPEGCTFDNNYNPTDYQIVTEVRAARLKRIISNYQTIEFEANTTRTDLDILTPLISAGLNMGTPSDPKRITGMTILGELGQCMREVSFYGDYFYSASTGFGGVNTTSSTGGYYPDMKRLKLDSVSIHACGGSDPLTYSFSYHDPSEVPRRKSHSQDHWGYYNGAEDYVSGGNQSLLPRLTYFTNDPLGSNGSVYSSFECSALLLADREARFPYMQAGTLKDITYPIGGTTEFEYEANDVNKDVIINQFSTLFSEYSCSYPQACNCADTDEITANNVFIPVGGDYKLTFNIYRGIDCNNNNQEFPGWITVRFYYNITGQTCGSCWWEYSLEPGEDNLVIEDINFENFNIVPGSSYDFRLEIYSPSNAIAYLSMNLTRSVQTVENRNIEVGGLRVASVTNNPGTGSSFTREYFYKDKWSPEKSSGFLVGVPVYMLPAPKLGFPVGSNCLNEPYYIFSANSIVPLSSTHGSHIGYEHVEVQDGSEGRSEYQFFKDPNYNPDFWIDENYPGTPVETISPLVGSLISEVHFDADNNPLKTTTYEYEIRTGFSIAGAMKYGKFISCDNFVIDEVIAYEPYYLDHHLVQLKKKTESQDGATKITDYEYNDPIYFTFLTAEQFNNSDGKTHRTEYTYSATSSCMLSKRITGIPIVTSNYISGNFASGSRIDYEDFAGKCLPARFYVWEGQWNLRTTVEAYDSDGNPEIVKRLGFLDREYYTWENNLLKEKKFKAWTSLWTYYDNSRLLESFTDIDGQDVKYYYDGLQRLETVSERVGAVTTTYEYSLGLPNSVTSTTTYTDNTPTQTIIEEFDGLGRALKYTHNGVIKKEYFYDGVGRLEKETYLPGNFMTYEYEPSPLHRVHRTIFPDNNYQITEYGADGNYPMLTTIDEKGNSSDVAVDFLGRQGLLRDALGGVTTFTYDTQGDLEMVENPNGGQYLYTYDSGHRLKTKLIPGGGEQIFEYDPIDHRLKYTIDANGNRLDYEYDAYGRENLVKYNEVDIASGNTGSPGIPVILYTYAEDLALGGINTGKLKERSVAMISGAGGPAITTYTYDNYGRVDSQTEQYPLGDTGQGTDQFQFNYNLADWLQTETRTHGGHEGLSVITTRIYDAFGRETTHIFGADQPTALSVAMTYNDRDQMTSKKLGSLGGNNYYEKLSYEYNERGWLKSINTVMPQVSDLLLCEPTVPNVDDDPGQVEETVGLEELIEQLCQGEDVAIQELDPCANGDCYVDLASFQATYLFRGPSTDGWIDSLFGNGQLIDELSYPFYPNSQDQTRFINELQAFLSSNGYSFEEVLFDVEALSEPVGWFYYRANITIKQTNFPFEYLIAKIDKFNRPVKFVQYNNNMVPCKNLPGPPIGEESEQAASIIQLDAEIATQTTFGLSYPTVLYKVSFPNGSSRWAFKDEIDVLRGTYYRTHRIHVENSSHIFTVEKNDGTITQSTLAQLLQTRAVGDLKEVESEEKDSPAEECNLEPLDCTPEETKEQVESLNEINNMLCNLDVSKLTFPISLYLVQLCDGSTTYILTSELLNELEGDYVILDELIITSPDQTFEILVIKKEPLFAMDFNYEPNGNIQRARWKVINSTVKLYDYSYDPLNRITGANYGHQVLEENPPGAYNLATYMSDVYSATGFSYDAVGNLLSVKRNGAIPDDCFLFGTIDDLTMTYDPLTNRLQSVSDGAPALFRDSGFKPNPNSTSNYTYDENGNLTYDPHKELTIKYNFLNLPKTIGGITFTYDALGRKWRKKGASVDKEYIMGIEYINGQLEAAYDQEGRIVPGFNQSGGVSGYRGEYWIKDHLGNARLAIADLNNSGSIEVEDDPNTPENESEIMQENHYYPFGMNHNGPWYKIVAPENKYQYNGKELNTDLGLNWNDYGARWYDASIGRWNAVDPKAEKYYSISPFAYVANNPLIFIDPNGAEIAIRFSYVEEGDRKYQTVIYRDGKLYDKEGNEYTSGPGFNKRGRLSGFLKDAKNALDRIKTTEKGLEMLNSLQIGSYKDGGTTVLLSKGGNDARMRKVGEGMLVEIGWIRGGGVQMLTDDGKMDFAPQEIGLAHELAHAWDYQQGTFDATEIGNLGGKPIRAAEYFATYVENRIRKDFGYPLRTFYASEQDTGPHGIPLSTYSGVVRVYDPIKGLHIKSSKNGKIEYYMFNFKNN